jgi:hypothetical protein
MTPSVTKGIARFLNDPNKASLVQAIVDAQTEKELRDATVAELVQIAEGGTVLPKKVWSAMIEALED